MKSINCDIIQDLLPSYVDNISSESTNKLVEEHIQSCKNCQDSLQSMSKDIDKKILENHDDQIDFLKGFRKDKIKSIIFAIALTLVIILSVFLLGNYLLFKFQDVHYSININDINLEYMYMTKINGKEKLVAYLYSDKYQELYTRPYWRSNATWAELQKNKSNQYELIDKATNKQIYFPIYTMHKISNLIFGNSTIASGVYCIYDIDEKTDKIYITTEHNGEQNVKEIWNKNMKVMTEEEWKKWYYNEYVPDEVVSLYGQDLTDARIKDTGMWRHIYQPKN